MQITPPPMPELDTFDCEACAGEGWNWEPRQVAERKSDTQEFKIPCAACDGRGYSGPDAERREMLTARDQQWLAIVKEAVEREREECAAECAGIYAGHAAEARRLEGREATHAAGQRDGANECAAAIRSRSTTNG